MFERGTIKAIADGMKGNADALLALASMVAACGLFAAGVPIWLAWCGPLTIFALYIFLRLFQKQQDVKMKQLEFDREKDANRLKIDQRQRKVRKS
ncbi:hypothetical protein [Breoghania sp.]|uniref:hypothetical protein n=1 Tax=Breoghania sp. TaxID=2065378 RepID=UPI002AAB979F|nr:hypothetical protein [Breoghania sp.]